MTAELGQSRDPARLVPGDLAALHRTIALWQSRIDDAEGSAKNLRGLRTVPEWSGEAADAYERRVDAAASPWDAMASAFRLAKTALEEFASALEAARGRAGDAVDLWEQAEAMDSLAVATAGSSGTEHEMLRSDERRTEARAVLDDARSSVSVAAQQTASALRGAIAVPGLDADEWLAVLNGCISAPQLLDAIAGADVPSLAAVLRARPALADVLAQGGPADVAPWWAALSGAQQRALISAAPAVIGNLGGVAYAARDRANRLWLDAQMKEARAALAEAENAEAPSYGSRANAVAGAEASAERLKAARARVAGLENIELALKRADGLPRQLISLTNDAPPLAAVSIGEIDDADVVTFAVPGMGATSEGMAEWSRVTQNLASEEDRVDPGRSHAVVAWVGYETPPVPIVDGGFDVMGTDLAEGGARNLVRDLAAAESVRPGAQVNVVAHSYGTTTAAIALASDSVQVDSFVTLGSAGLPPQIDTADDLRAEHVYSGQAQDVWALDPTGGDQWAWTGRLSIEHPVNPIDPAFGAHAFGVAGQAGLQPVTDHGVSTADGTGYLDKRTESLKNVALATTGHDDLMSPYIAPGPTPLQKTLIEGMTRGFPY